MKIAFVYDTVYPWVTGGAERRIYEIGKRLSKKGHDVHLYSLGYWKNSLDFIDEDVISYEGMTLHSVGKAMDLYTKNDTRSIKEALYFSRRILTNANFEDFDIIDCQGFPYFSCYTSKIKTHKNSKLVITLHEVWNDYWYEYMGKIGFVGKIVEKGILHLTDNVICVSKATYNNMIKNHKPENSTIIENGVNFREIEDTKESSEKCDVLYAGRLIPEKHVDLLIHAISTVSKTKPDIKCFIVGEGPMKDELESLVDSLDINQNVIFKGFCDDQKELYSLMKGSSLFVLPSKREGFGIVVVEANSCGVPVITIDSPMNASKDLIKENTNGWVVGDDHQKLADLILKVLIEDTSSMKNDCISFAIDYDWDNIASRTENYYLDILDK